jgi:excisionase family DNA binding protein
MDKPTVYTLDEACEYLRISRSTFHRLLASGQIEGPKVGGQWRFTQIRLDTILNRTDKPSERVYITKIKRTIHGPTERWA